MLSKKFKSRNYLWLLHGHHYLVKILENETEAFKNLISETKHVPSYYNKDFFFFHEVNFHR